MRYVHLDLRGFDWNANFVVLGDLSLCEMQYFMV